MPNHDGAASSALPQRICLLVLGMHRSGTSAMTRVINLLGADLPKTLLGEGRGNERGHWEPAPLITHHDHLLEQLGSRWDDWRKLDLGAFPPSLHEEAARTFHTLIGEEYGASPMFVLKDPRICRFVPFMEELLAARNVATRHVLMLRNPLAVVASLAERDGMTAGFAALMWLRHVLDAEAATRHAPRAIVSYENLLRDWRAAMRTVGARVGIRWPCPIEVSGPQVEAFLSAELQHHAPSRHELAAHRDIADWVKATYGALRALERDADDEAACRTLDGIAAEFDAVAPTFAAAMFPELSARERKAAESLAERSGVADELRRALGEREAEVSRLRDEVAAREAEVAEARALRGDVAAHQSKIASLAELAAEREREIAALKIEVATKMEEYVAVRSDADGKGLRVAQLEREAAEHVAALAAATEKAAQSANETDNLKSALAAKEATLRAAEELRDRAQIELRRMQASRSWRVTRPLRALADRRRWAGRQMGRTAAPRWRFAGSGLLSRRIRRLRLRRDRQLVLASGLFDADWYLKQHADVATACADPAVHYLLHGAQERRDPSEFFSSSWYLQQNPDVLKAGVNPLVHYLQHGAREGRLPRPEFDTEVVPPRDRYAQTIIGVICPRISVTTARVYAHISPNIRIVDESEAPLLQANYYHFAADEHSLLSEDALRLALLTLTCRKYDGVIISSSLSDSEIVEAPSVIASGVWSPDCLSRLRANQGLPETFCGRLLRVLPARNGAPLRQIELQEYGPVRRRGLHILAGSNGRADPKFMPPRDFELATEHDGRPLVLVMPALFAVGGAERNTIEIVKSLAGRYRFIVVTNEPPQSASGSLNYQLSGLVEAIFELGEVAATEHHIEILDKIGGIYRPDLIWICNGSSWLSNNMTELRKIFPNTPIVDQQVYDDRHGWINSFSKGIGETFDRFVAINSRIRTAFTERYAIPRSKIDLIYHAIDSRRFTPSNLSDAEISDRRKRFDVPPERKLLGFVARLTAQKRPLDFLAMVSRVCAKFPDYTFVMVGDGDLAADCDAAIKHLPAATVVRLPFCADMSELYPLLSGLVLTSEFEGLPIVMLEALAMGVPVFSTDVGDVAEVLGEYSAGLIGVDAIGNPTKLAASFEKFLGHLPLFTEAAKRASPLVQARFSAEAIAAKYEECWRRAMYDRPGVGEQYVRSASVVEHRMGRGASVGISVVIPTYNRREALVETLRACQTNAKNFDVEFVVVDDGSKDDTAKTLKVLAEEMPNLVWRSVLNGGPGQARNVGAAIASKDVILFMGDDIEPVNENFFSAHCELHAKEPSDALAVLGKTTWPDRASWRANFVMSLVQGRGQQQFGYAYLSPFSELDYRFFYTSNVSIKRRSVSNWLSDGFSSAFPLAAYEDVEFAYRMSRRPQGLRIVYAPMALAMHKHHYTAAQFIDRQIGAGMMAQVFAGLHPEVAQAIGIADLHIALAKPATAGDDKATADYAAIIEGVKAWARILDNRHDLGSLHWHEDLLNAVFGLAYLQGAIIAHTKADANIAAAYEYALDQFVAGINRACHVEVFGNTLNPAVISPWQSVGRQRALDVGNAQPTLSVSAFYDASMLGLRSWARSKPMLVTAYRRVRGR